MHKTHIHRAIDALGGQRPLADAISVSPAMVWQWAKGVRPVASRHCIAIETATKGKVTRYELCPDVFGEAPKPRKRKAA